MAKHVLDEPAYVNDLLAALMHATPQGTLECERVINDRYRVTVTWSGFENMSHPERQLLVWNTAEEALDPANLLKISAILTFAPSELGGD